MCAAALEAGKHVICDKPMALNGHEAEQMLEAARQHPDQVPFLTLPRHDMSLLSARCIIADVTAVAAPYNHTCVHADACKPRFHKCSAS